jgi:transposase
VSDTELLHKSKPEPVRRLEVFTGGGRRRSWTAEQKAQILAESYESGEKVSAVARRHGLTPQQLFGWRRDAQRAVARRGMIERASSPVFTPVIVDAAQPSKQVPIAPAQLSGSLAIEIVIGGATIRIPGVDAETLAIVLRAVKATP